MTPRAGGISIPSCSKATLTRRLNSRSAPQFSQGVGLELAPECNIRIVEGRNSDIGRSFHQLRIPRLITVHLFPNTIDHRLDFLMSVPYTTPR